MVEGALKIAQRSGAQTIVITESAKSALAPLADVLLTSPTQSTFFGNSLIGPLALVNALLSELLVRNRRRVLSSFREYESFAAMTRDIAIDGDEMSMIDDQSQNRVKGP